MNVCKKSDSMPIEYEPNDEVKRLQWLAFVRKNESSKTLPKSSKGSIIDWGEVAIENIIDDKVFTSYEVVARMIKDRKLSFFYFEGYSMVVTNSKLTKCFICLVEPQRIKHIRCGIHANLEVPKPDDRPWGHYANVNCPKKQVNESGKSLLKKYKAAIPKEGGTSLYKRMNPDSIFESYLHDIMGVL